MIAVNFEITINAFAMIVYSGSIFDNGPNDASGLNFQILKYIFPVDIFVAAILVVEILFVEVLLSRF